MKKCPCCDNGYWFSECCNGAGGCSCGGEPVQMGPCHVCDGTGRISETGANLRANADWIKGRGLLFLGSGPSSGMWAGKGPVGNIV